MKKQIMNDCLLAAILWLFVACMSNDDGAKDTLTGDTSVELYSVVNQSNTFTITSTGNWTATCDAKWVTFSPKKGEAGTHTITVSTTETNRTRSERTARLTLTAGSSTKVVMVRQRGEYAVFDEEEHELPASGGTFSPQCSSNLSTEELRVYFTQGLDEWISVQQGVRTKGDYRYTMNPLKVAPNTERNDRDGAIFLVSKTDKGDLLLLDTLWIYQKGLGSNYTSTDYTHDGEVELLNRSTQGQGVSVVLMGDGFLDKDIADGTYRRVMEKTMEQLFSEEPVKSLRNFFDVYMLTAVSPNDLFGKGYTTALGTEPDHQSMAIAVDNEKVLAYMEGLTHVDLKNTLVVVILNSSIDRGCTYYYSEKSGNPMQYSVALTTMFDGLETEKFRTVLIHEAIGHGLTKLADEYVDSDSGSATEDDIKDLKTLHGYEYFLNVDSESNPDKVIWNSLINDSRYDDEKLGVYEGGWTYFKGIFRPTEESMMNRNDCPFNAPSRRAIFNKVMKLAWGKTPTYEEFAEFDNDHKPTTWTYNVETRSPWSDYLHLRKKSCIKWRQSSWSTPPTH
jgi:hypothetical protein